MADQPVTLEAAMALLRRLTSDEDVDREQYIAATEEAQVLLVRWDAQQSRSLPGNRRGKDSGPEERPARTGRTLEGSGAVDPPSAPGAAFPSGARKP